MMEVALTRNAAQGSITLVDGANDPAAIAANEVAREAGREREMKFVGVHVLPDGQVEAVREGILDATIKFANGAREAIATALETFA